MNGPLTGISVVDLTTVVMGPYACQLLGDYGADVIKIEAPDGDVMRLSGPMRNPGMGHLYMSTNRNKRSIVIDLKTDRGRRLLLDLSREADILLYNIRPKAMGRLGLSYEDLRAVNPRLIYVGAFGFSQRGPYAAKPAYDDLIQGMTGIPWLFLQAGATEPHYAPTILADRIVGIHVALAAVSALHHRDRTGEGQKVDVPMYESLLSIVLGEHLAGKAFVPPVGPTGYRRSLSNNRRPYRTKDGYICTLVYSDKHWRSFFHIIDQPHVFEQDPRFSSQAERLKHIDEVYAYLAGILSTRTTNEWLTALTAADIPAARMNSIDDILADEHIAAIDFLRTRMHPSEGTILEIGIPTEWSASQPAVLRHAPTLGEHSVEILQELGLSSDVIASLLREAIVKTDESCSTGREA